MKNYLNFFITENEEGVKIFAMDIDTLCRLEIEPEKAHFEDVPEGKVISF